ncbi:retrovirus-related Pol polyprotein from type-1 retrotransposable element R1 [Trichonephila clavipes]|nr:retrovirus-related Pol polyprotein from type-1 retrotransposable element R1 [Trichonephila clavipes]
MEHNTDTLASLPAIIAKPSYAQVASPPAAVSSFTIPPPSSEKVLLVRPLEPNADSSTTRNKITSFLLSKNLPFRITRIKNINNGVIAICLTIDEDVSKLSQELSNNANFASFSISKQIRRSSPIPLVLNDCSPPSCLSPTEVEVVFRKLRGGKAPGIDLIDYAIWKILYNSFPNLLFRFFNLCIQFNHFPSIFRNIKIKFFLKPGRDPSSTLSYRPICLLSSLGKIVERTFLDRFLRWISKNNILHRSQFGFRENRSCIEAVDK